MSEFLASAEVRIVPNTAGFRQTLLAELTAATRGLKVQIPVLAGVAKGTTIAAAEQKQLAASQLKGAATATVNANAQKELARVFGGVAEVAKLEQKALQDLERQQLKTAAAQSQLARGAGATGLSLLGARGATLAAGSEFLIGAAAVTVLAKAVRGAVDDEEALFGVTKVLGDQLGKKLAADAATLADTFGVADEQALKFEGALSATLRNVGLADSEIVKLDKSLVRVAANLAAVRHVPVEATLKAIQLAVSGNTRALRQYGIVIQNSEVQQRALADSGKKTKDELTRQELTLARTELLYKRAAFAAGGFAANQDSVANRAKILQANINDLGDSIGKLALGPLATFATVASRVAANLKKVADAGSEENQKSRDATGFHRLLNIALKVSEHDYQIFAAGIRQANKGLSEFAVSVGLAKSATAGLPPGLLGVQGAADGATSSLSRLGGSVAGLVGPMTVARQAALDLRAALAGLGGADFKLLRLQASGAPLSAQLSAAQAVLDKAAAAVAAADLTEARKGKSTAQKALLQKELAARQTVAGIQGQIDAAAKKEATAAKKEAKTRQQILDEQDQALLNEQQLAQGQVEIAKAKAQRTQSLVDDIAVDRRELALVNQQIKDAEKIHDDNLRLQTIQQLTLQSVQLQSDIADKIAEQIQKRRQRRLDAAEAAVQSADLDAQLAETLKHPRDQIAALLRENAALEKEKNLWKGNTLKQKEIRNQIAENNATIKEIKKGLNQRSNLMNEIGFAFLTAQQGFAATLLSNLIPTSAAAGTVGGGAISTATGGGGTVPLGDSGFVQREGRGDFPGLHGASQIAGAPKGATAGQFALLLHIQRQQLEVLMRLVGQRTHPEARFQAASVGPAEFTGPLNT